MSATTAAERSPVPRFVAIQAVSGVAAWTLAPAWLPVEGIAAATAVVLTWASGMPRWWFLINAAFVPSLAGALALELPPVMALVALGALLLVFGRIWSSRVPLFFSSDRAQDALATLLPADRPMAFLDAGCGDARVVEHLATLRPRSRIEGIEHAWLPWLLARFRCWRRGGEYYVRRGDLWAHGLTQYDVVYAYLSPVVMPRFWEKAQREMRPGALLVSAFEVPGVSPECRFHLRDAMGTRLNVCRIGGETTWT